MATASKVGLSTARRRAVHTRATSAERACLFCLGTDGPFRSEEHVIPRSLGPETDRYVIPPGVVCDPCNGFLGRQVDAPFVDRFDMRLMRALEGLRGRKGAPPLVIDGHEATARLELELAGVKVTLYAAHADESQDGGLDIEIRPVDRDPADIVARSIRALWKIALGCAWLARGPQALDPCWDHLRHGVLGAPFKGFLLQAPFAARVTRRLDVNIDLDTPTSPFAATFILGGVALAAPLANGARVTRADARRAGWEVHTTDTAPPKAIHLRLDPV